MDNRHIFLQTLYDIRQKLNGEKYHYIRACGLLRHLFLDQNPLLHLVNRELRIPIFFHVSDYKISTTVKS